MSVRARDPSANWSPLSNPLTVTTAADVTAPSAPSGLVSRNLTATGFVLEWAAAAEPAAPGQGLLQDSVFQDDHGIALGTAVVIRAESFGAETTEGTLVAATRTHFSLRRVDKRAGVVHVHFPRIGYVMDRV